MQSINQFANLTFTKQYNNFLYPHYHFKNYNDMSGNVSDSKNNNDDNKIIILIMAIMMPMNIK